jgi:hypothetical protein
MNAQIKIDSVKPPEFRATDSKMEQVEQIVINDEENCVYAMVNPTMQFNGYWLIKIGETTELNQRERQASQSTWIPREYETAMMFQCKKSKYRKATEQLLHKLFDGRRHNDSREFFEIQLQEVEDGFRYLENCGLGKLTIYDIDRAFWDLPGKIKINRPRAKTPSRSRSRVRINGQMAKNENSGNE